MNGNVEEINDDDENLSLTEEQQEKLKQVTEEFFKKARENSESIKNILQVIPNYGVSVTQELIEAGKKFKIRYEEKKRLWEQDRNYYKNKGFDREFQEMLFELAKLNPDINRKAIGQIFGMEKGEFRDLFDDWFVRYEAERDRKLAEKRKLVTPTSTDTNEGKKEIYILPENIEPIYNALAPYFQRQETELRRLLEGETIEERLNWSKNANQLTHVFWGAKKEGWISDTNVQICEWILKNFKYNNGKIFDRSSVTKDLNTQVTRCKKPLPNTDF